MPRRALLALSVALVALAGCGGGSSSGGDDPASAVPRDAAMYFDATVRPQGSQRGDALAAAGKALATDDPEAKLRELVGKALAQSDGLKLDYARDIEPWLGEKAAFWLAPSQDETREAAVLATTDADAAQAAIDRAVKSSGQTFSKRSYKGVDYQVNGEGGAAAVADDFVVLGSEPELKRTLETLDGGKALADDGRYKDATGRLDDGRLGTMYLDYRTLFALARRNPQAGAQFDQLQRLFPIDRIGSVAVGFAANGDRLAVDSVTPNGRELAQRFGAFTGTGHTPLVGELPGDAWGALGVPKLGETAKALYAQLAGALGGAAIEQQLRSQFGLDLERDVFSWIGDVAVFARGTSASSISGGAVIEVTDEERAKAAFGKLVGLAQSRGGLDAKPISIPGAETAFAISRPGQPKPVVAARGKERVVVAVGEAAAADALQPKEKLEDSDTYAQAKSVLGDDYEPGLVLSMPAIVELAEAAAPGDRDLAQAKPYLEAFGVLAAGGKLEGDTSRSRFAAALK